MVTFLKKNRRKIIEWSLWIAIPLILYATGWYTEVIGRMQQVILYTGIFHAHPIENTVSQPVVNLDMAMSTLNGDRVNLQEFRGKVLFINFWASWCPPCVAEMPTILKLSGEINDPEIRFILINMDQNREKARDFIRRKGIDLPVYQPVNGIPKALSSSVIPATFIINKSGKMVLRHEGMADYSTGAIRSLLDTLARQ